MVTRAVLFVEPSTMGELARQIKEQVHRLDPNLEMLFLFDKN